LTSSPPSSGLSPAVPPECPALPAGNWRRGLRSLRDLTQHLTTRADDSHAAPVLPFPCGHPRVSAGFDRCQGLVRFCALLRIKPHAPPLVRAPVNSFEFQPCGRTPQAARLPRWLRHRGTASPDTQRASFTARTTRVSNPVCSPRCRASASGRAQAAAFATGVPPNIYEFHLYTGDSAALCPPPAPPSRAQSQG
jgi:hypothetical protein